MDFFFAADGASNLGINYGMVADNLPPPSEVVSILQSISVSKTRIYNANLTVLKAFANSGISIIVGIGNEDVSSMTDASFATNWVQSNVASYYPATLISGLAVGNEVFTGTDTQLMANLLPAMQNLHSALASLGLDSQIIVSTAHSLAVLSSSFPPSGGAFVSSIASLYLMPMLQFLKETGAPFMINAYPYFAYKESPGSVSLEYVLFEATSSTDGVTVTDPNTGLLYTNMLEAQVDAIYYAMEALGYADIQAIVSETGWPSAGDADEAGASVQNAQAYNANLIKRLATGKGTPARPSVTLQAFIFALFNEDLKDGASSERHYGLFNPDGTRAYDFGLDTTTQSYTLYNSMSASNDASSTLSPNLTLSFTFAIALTLLVFLSLFPFTNPSHILHQQGS